MKRPLPIVLWLCCLLTGCIPMRMAVGKRIDGVVVDVETRAPIAGAHVMYQRRSGTIVMTDSQGEFTLERQVVTFWHPLLPVDYFGLYHHPVLVCAPGYKSKIFRPRAQPEPESVRVELAAHR